ncbi:MAG: DUF86 domain-containing protein [Deltaproteobacteria bacterium]|nr:DUF86 domain-containing protein [Deltaproteobacteria bacterium]MBW2595691.1 DUF86 domain-containing protein [Deltaproteobacteria bacterium]MBW2651157.1 DUF86 domain-containing protein [Deltaproteobacteria bacterium]
MQFEDKIRLRHILDEAAEACHYVEGITFDEFAKEGKTVRAVIRCIEVIGEAVSKISIEFREEHPDVPWQKIIGMRNRLIHVYFDIDYNIIWQTAKENLPPLIEQLQSILKNEE